MSAWLESHDLRVLKESPTNHDFLLFTLIRTCTDESKLCKGVALCQNKEDLKFCKNATSWSLPDTDFKPIYLTDSDNYVSCNHLKDQPNPQGQQIKKSTNNDGRVYNCVNRRDEEPFKANKAVNSTEGGAQKKWLDDVNSPCPIKDTRSSKYRRCLGQRADHCIKAYCKFLIL